MMETRVVLCRIDSGSISDVGSLFSEFDASRTGATTGIRRRQLFHYDDLFIHLRDLAPGATDDDLLPVGAAEQLATRLTPLGSGPATRFYTWSARDTTGPEPLYSTVVVNRMDPVHIPEVCRLFEELDATDF